MLWQALRTIIAENIDRYTSSLAGTFADQAQRASGVTLDDPAIREHFAALVRIRIAPVCMGRAAAQVAGDTHCSFATWGAGWSSVLDGQEVCRGAIPLGKELNDTFHTVRIVVLPCYSLAAVQSALDALVAGVSVVCRAPDQPFAQLHPALAPLEPHLHLYRTKRELAKTLNRLRRHPDLASDESSAARSTILAQHCVSHRIQAIVAQVRGSD
jgi:hypothetical protein